MPRFTPMNKKSNAYVCKNCGRPITEHRGDEKHCPSNTKRILITK